MEPTGIDISTVVTGAVADLGPEMAVVAGAGLAIGAALFGLRKGWKAFKGFTS